MSFRSVFIALVIGFGLVLGGFLVNGQRPAGESSQSSAAMVRATGKCAECHLNRQYSIVHEYELSKHAQKGINCLECHQPQANQGKIEHNGFTISQTVTAANCRSSHETEYQQYLRSRHAAPSWAAVYGEKGLTAEQVEFSEKYQPGATKRPPNALVALEGAASVVTGCVKCHGVGKPNVDGTIGSCTACHTRHTSSVEIARLPTSCGQCHMGPDHSQLEIYNESKHGVIFAAQKDHLKLDADPQKLTTRDMFIPTCATCHMSGLNGQKVTHDPSERLSYLLAAEISAKRPGYALAQANMKETCTKCHTTPVVERIYAEAEAAVATTNAKVKAAKEIYESLRADKVIEGPMFSQPVDFLYFDLWHYYGRTAKHGAFMGGQDFAQWHGNYPILHHTIELKAMAEELRRSHASPK